MARRSDEASIGILHAIFFHRFFPSVLPQTREVLDLTLPHVEEAELETMIDQRTAALVRQLDAERGQPHSGGPGGSGNGGGGRGQITVLFFEKRRRKNWFAMRGEEEVCWESWTVKVTVAEPRTEAGSCCPRSPSPPPFAGPVAQRRAERAKVRKAMESTLLTAVMKIVTSVNSHKDHIPPITTTDANPFPYQIIVNHKEAGWATRMGILS